uniref:Uncharacterized protein n=1 Tax=Anguilla anguilla TaxID=7936 RepID=A0A0E9V136_ANGAN
MKYYQALKRKSLHLGKRKICHSPMHSKWTCQYIFA